MSVENISNLKQFLYRKIFTEKLKASSLNTPKVADLEKQLKKSEEDSKQLASKIKELEEKIKKQDNLVIF